MVLLLQSVEADCAPDANKIVTSNCITDWKFGQIPHMSASPLTFQVGNFFATITANLSDQTNFGLRRLGICPAWLSWSENRSSSMHKYITANEKQLFLPFEETVALTIWMKTLYFTMINRLVSTIAKILGIYASTDLIGTTLRCYLNAVAFCLLPSIHLERMHSGAVMKANHVSTNYCHQNVQLHLSNRTSAPWLLWQNWHSIRHCPACIERNLSKSINNSLCNVNANCEQQLKQ